MKNGHKRKQIRGGTANGQVASSTATATLPITKLNADFPTKGYIMPTFTNKLIGVGHICDANYTLVFREEDVTVLSPQGKPIIQGWREDKLSRLWRFALSPDERKEKLYTTTSHKIQRQIMSMTYPAWRHLSNICMRQQVSRLGLHGLEQ